MRLHCAAKSARCTVPPRRFLRQRPGVEHIEIGAAPAAGRERIRDCGHVDDFATRDVGDTGATPQQA